MSIWSLTRCFRWKGNRQHIFHVILNCILSINYQCNRCEAACPRAEAMQVRHELVYLKRLLSRTDESLSSSLNNASSLKTAGMTRVRQAYGLWRPDGWLIHVGQESINQAVWEEISLARRSQNMSHCVWNQIILQVQTRLSGKNLGLIEHVS